MNNKVLLAVTAVIFFTTINAKTCSRAVHSSDYGVITLMLNNYPDQMTANTIENAQVADDQ